MKQMTIIACLLLAACSSLWLAGCRPDGQDAVFGPANSSTSRPSSGSGTPALDKAKYVATGGDAPGFQVGTDSAVCTTASDTWVGSDSTTYGDKVVVWHNAISSNLMVRVNYLNTSTVEFLPSMDFAAAMPEVHMSYKYSGISDNDAKHMRIFWLDQTTNTWIAIDNNPVVDTNLQEFVFTVKHFSIYAFGR
jgi:hypothetical protein